MWADVPFLHGLGVLACEERHIRLGPRLPYSLFQRLGQAAGAVTRFGAHGEHPGHVLAQFRAAADVDVPMPQGTPELLSGNATVVLEPWGMSSSPRTCLVTGRVELEQILQLQAANLREHVPPEQAAREGFLTVAHTLEVLEQMHALAPSIIAKEGERLAGYALVMPVETRAFVPVLEPMFQLLQTLSWRGRPLREWGYYIMGQVCVAEAFRGQGVFDALYREHRARYAERFACTVTEVSTRNTRSLRAHARVGFEVLETYRDATDEWAVMVWSLRDGTR